MGILNKLGKSSDVQKEVKEFYGEYKRLVILQLSDYKYLGERNCIRWVLDHCFEIGSYIFAEEGTGKLINYARAF